MSKNLKDELFKDFPSGSIKSWAKKIIDEVKASLGIGSGKSPMRDEVGKALSKELGDGLLENSKESVEAFKLVKAELDYQRELDLIDDETYYDRLEVIRDRYFAQGSENWVKYTAEVYKYQKELLENESKNLNKIYDNVADYADEKFKEILKKQEKFTAELSDFGGIYKKNTVTINGEKSVYYSTRDLRKDIKEIESYASRLSELKNLLKEGGLSNEVVTGFLEEINDMGIREGLSFMNYLHANGKDNTIAYANLWGEKLSVSKAMGEELYRDEFEETAEAVAYSLKNTLEKAGYDIPEGFFESGKISAENFGTAFLEELEIQLGMIRAKIQDFAGTLAVNGSGGDTYNTTNTQYNITAADSGDTVEQIKRYETVKRLSGI